MDRLKPVNLSEIVAYVPNLHSSMDRLKRDLAINIYNGCNQFTFQYG